MRSRRIIIVLDVSAALETVERELSSFREWMTAERLTDVSVGLIVYGLRASWVPAPDTTRLARSAIVRGVGAIDAPALADALLLAAEGACEALVTMIVAEPASDWATAMGAVGARCRAVVSLSDEPSPAVGNGHLGAPFRREHLGLALRWITREVCDHTWRCVCGDVRSYPADAGARCPSCGALPELPPRLRIGERIVLLTPNARLYAHHVGKSLDFTRPLAELDGLEKRAGRVSVAGFDAEIRTGPAAASSAPRADSRSAPGRTFRPPAVRGLAGRCSACEEALGEVFLHEPPDPRRFCDACVKSESRCDFCRVPLGPRPNTWPDGRTSCRECWSTAVTEAPALAALGESARAWMKRRLGMEMPPCPLQFEHAAAIARMQGHTFRPVARSTARAIGFFRKPGEVEAALFVEHGAPSSVAYGILVHELTHLWQWHHWPHEAAITLVEGLAMWVEYQALLDAGAIHTARHAERYGDPIYGLGFRLALAVEKDVGFDRVKDRMPFVDLAASLRA